MVSKSGSLDLSRSFQFLFLVPHETYFLTRSVHPDSPLLTTPMMFFLLQLMYEKASVICN